MKKLALLFGLLLATTISYSQCSTYKPRCSSYREYSPLQLSVNYGIAPSLGGELLYQNGKNIIGFGYVGYFGKNTANLSLDQNQYHIKNEGFYLTYARQINSWVIGIKFGKQNDADWNKKVLSYDLVGNPNSYTFEKDENDYTTMVGASVGYCFSNRFRVNVGVDSFSTATLGFTIGF
jgi:hypothetical protein